MKVDQEVFVASIAVPADSRRVHCSVFFWAIEVDLWIQALNLFVHHPENSMVVCARITAPAMLLWARVCISESMHGTLEDTVLIRGE